MAEEYLKRRNFGEKKFWRMSAFANFGAIWRNLFWRFDKISKFGENQFWRMTFFKHFS